MAEKIYDIIPPKRKKNLPIIDKKEKKDKTKEFSQKLLSSPEQVDFVLKKERGGRKLKFRSFFSKSLLICFVFFVLLVILGWIFFSKTRIEIWPQTDIIFLEETITVDLNKQEIDFENKIIPGELFYAQKSDSLEFPASGKMLKQGKAEGIIRVYNNYSVSSQGLLPNTRFVSADGKLFRTIKIEVISGGRYEKGKFVAGETDVKVIAAEPGEEYNIEPSTFSIPGFAGTDKYTAFYGKSFSPMSGGFESEAPQVSQKDLDEAKIILSERLESEGRESLKTSLGEDFTLLDETISQEITEEKYSVEAGAETDLFDFYATIKSSGLTFRTSDLRNFVNNLIYLNIDEGKKFQEEKLDIDYYFDSLDREQGLMILNLEVKAEIYPDIDLDVLKDSLLGRSVKEVRIFLDNQEDIVKTKINLIPFWKKYIPSDKDKLEIRMNL